jgi:hypothetical protein
MISDDPRRDAYMRAQELWLDDRRDEAATAFAAFLDAWPDPDPGDDEPLEQIAALNLAGLVTPDDPPQARRLYRSVAAGAPPSLARLALIGVAAVDRTAGLPDASAALLEEIIARTEQRPDDALQYATALRLRHQTATATGDADMAASLRARWASAIAAHPPIALATARDARALAADGSWPDARVALQVVLEAADATLAAELVRQTAEAIADDHRAIEELLTQVGGADVRAGAPAPGCRGSACREPLR